MLKKSALLLICSISLLQARAQQLFTRPALKEDSITVTGLYKNYNWKTGDAFTIGTYDWTTGEQARFSTPIGQDGKFRIRFPMQMANMLYMDWGRLFEITTGIPGETFHLEADMNDYPDISAIAASQDTAKLRQFMMRKRNVAITGNNARLHNEILRYQWAAVSIAVFDNSWGDSAKTELEYRNLVMDQYNRAISHLENYGKTHKLLPATKQVLEADIRYNAAMDLTQFQYQLNKLKQPKFSDEYLNTLRQLTSLDASYGYLSGRFVFYLKDMKAYAGRTVAQPAGNNMMLINNHSLDSVLNTYFRDPLLLQMLTTWDARSNLEKNPEPMKDVLLKEFESKVTDPVLRKSIYRENARLAAVTADNTILKDTKLVTTMPDVETTEEVFNYIVSQHKGSVIYIDIWGTWCGPCREQMQYVPEMKKQLEGKNVVFVYLASSSPEEAWKNMIKYYKLTGHNVVHYNLPQKQQALFEKGYLDRGWPTYIIVDKEGKFVTKTAPRPQNAADVVDAIGKLL